MVLTKRMADVSAEAWPLQETPDVLSSTEDYARRFGGPVGEYFLETQAAIVRDWLPPPGSCRVLDVGGGHAQLAAPLIAEGYCVTVLGSDLSCRQRLDRLVGKDRYAFCRGDLLNLPFSAQSFDVVLAFRMLPHLRQWRRFLGEICRVAESTVVLDYPDWRSANCLAEQLYAVKSAMESDTRRYRCFRRREIITELKRHGFYMRQSRGQFFIPMALHRFAGSSALSRASEALARTVGLTSLFGSPVIVHATATPFNPFQSSRP